MFLEKIVEMIGIFKTQAIADIGHAPVGVTQQGPCFVYNTLADMCTGRAAGDLTHGKIEVIYMYR